MTDPADADDRDEPPDPRDALGAALRGARPTHGDVLASLARARVAGQLFGDAEPVRIGRYELEARAGAGGSGDVFAARDPELSRRVAIKLMRAGGYRDRMLAEGHALARLSHPNIVPVYDAGTLDDQVYVVMELVEGDTLRAYCGAGGRSVREVVRAYRQAAEGLAAAHRAGFIHRDFKPDNALIGRDGRVRVVDFGLARGTDGDAAGRDGDAAGTPRYMAPEQAAGGQLTPAADQYALCASLREGLLARGAAVPRWLAPILDRGTARDPAARYPSLAAVDAALARDPASRWRARGAAAGVLGIAAVGFLLGRGGGAAQPSCERGAAELAATWGVTAPAQIAGHLAGLAAPYARDATPHVVTTLDHYARRWRDGQRDACAAHRDGAQSSAVFDRRIACLAHARAALRSAVAVIGAASDEHQLVGAVGAIGQLPDLDRCADPAALVSAVAPPSPTAAAAVAAASDQLAALEVEVRAARPGVRPRITAAIGAARELGYPPLIARALWLDGFAALAVDAHADAVAPLAEATGLALTAGDHPLAVDAFARRMYAAGTIAPTGEAARGDPRAGVELIQAIADGLPPAERAIRALLDNSLGSVALAAGRRDDARAAFERALRTAREVTATPELATIWSNAALVVDDPARRQALARERIAIVEAGVGAGHPLALVARITAAYLETDPRRTRDALAPACDRLAALHPESGFEILQCQFQLGWLAVERGDDAAARAAFTRVVASEANGGHGARLAIARAHLARLAGQPAEARRELAAALAGLGPIERATWWMLPDHADALVARAALDRSAGRPAEARAAFDAARTALETVLRYSTLPRNARRLAYAQAGLARSWPGPLPPDARRHAEAALSWYRAAGGYDDAIAELERALGR
ncbi:MAG TPA: serine/threonine-protein kinase [Kofleriaceae bacterium]|nr:serine/threonine-protein kinase [Kofleriaceae bacterium]